MIGLTAIFWMFILLFGIVGAMRGWAKELLVTFAVILTLFIVTVLEKYMPIIKDALAKSPDITFWVRMILMMFLVFFGYQSPTIPRLASNNRFARDKLQDSLLGFILGATNAYLFIGTTLFYLEEVYKNTTKYPVDFIIAPTGDALKTYTDLMALMPPVWLIGEFGVGVFIAVAVAFAFVLIVFL